MLVQLLIRNIALIDRVELQFGKGLHVLTGETGAGKSIVVDAMNLVLGAKSDKNLIRAGEEKAYAEGLFDVSDAPLAMTWLKEHEIECDDHLVAIAREIHISGRTTSRIQGILVPLTQLRELAAMLMDMHGQHEHQSLLDEKNHLSMLDAMGDSAHRVLMTETESAFRAYHAAAAAYRKAKKESQLR